MNSTSYLNSLVADLESDGVKGCSVEMKKSNNTASDFELETILRVEKASGVKFSDEQREVLLNKSNACIVACAGSGKTSVSTSLIAKRVITGEIVDVNKLIYTTYSKAGADEMKVRLDKLFKTLGINQNVQVRTLHSFFLQILRLFGVGAAIIKNERLQFIRESCVEAKYALKDDDLSIIDNLLSFQVNSLLSDKKTVESYVNILEELTVEKYTQIRTGYSKKKAEKGLIDYDDMQSYLYLWLVKFAKSENDVERETARQVKEYCRTMWTDFYIDEAQDVSKIQFAIIRAIIADDDNPNKLNLKLTFIGDDDQNIYSWRGGDSGIILSIATTFDLKAFVLSTNYRCKSEIVDYAAKGIECNKSRYNKSMSANQDGGNVEIIRTDKEDLNSLSKLALNHIKWWRDNGESFKEVAVLSRNNFHLALLNNMLLREGIFCDIKEDMKLTKSYMYRDIKTLIDLCEPSWKSDYTSNMLWKLCRYMNRGTAKVIADFQNASSLTLEDTLGYIIKKFVTKEVSFNKNIRISIQAEERLAYYMEKMVDDSKTDMLVIYKALTSGNKENCLRLLMYLYSEACSYLYKSKDKSRSIKGLMEYINDIMSVDGFDKTKDFLRVTEQYENGKVGIIDDKVTLSTIHSAKGREWKNVIMFACDNVSQPSLGDINKMLDDNISYTDVCENINEERRLFYVGNTRAKEHLVVITYKMPSMFILEALGILDKTVNCNDKIVRIAQGIDKEEIYLEEVNKILCDASNKFYYDHNKYMV